MVSRKGNTDLAITDTTQQSHQLALLDLQVDVLERSLGSIRLPSKFTTFYLADGNSAQLFVGDVYNFASVFLKFCGIQEILQTSRRNGCLDDAVRVSPYWRCRIKPTQR
jgi:hypothetical protein